MNQPILQSLPRPLVYPESDGKPMADNSKQFRWIFVLYGNLAAQYREAADVYVAGNMFWYPVESHVEIVIAPDVFVVFGRPKGDRGSYLQWEEGDVPLTVVFEVLSPGNTYTEMDDKLLFYEEHRVEEYYVYDPDNNRLQIYLRRGETFVRIRQLADFVSPRLRIRFVLSGGEMVVYGPNGNRFLTFEELYEARAQAERQVAFAEQQLAQAIERAEQTQRQATRLAELSRKARRQQATAEELAELERLEEPPNSVPPDRPAG